MTDVIAYIDPGSGSLIVQAVIATIVAVPFFFRQQIGRAVRTIRRGRGANSTNPEDASSAAAHRDA